VFWNVLRPRTSMKQSSIFGVLARIIGLEARTLQVEHQLKEQERKILGQVNTLAELQSAIDRMQGDVQASTVAVSGLSDQVATATAAINQAIVDLKAATSGGVQPQDMSSLVEKVNAASATIETNTATLSTIGTQLKGIADSAVAADPGAPTSPVVPPATLPTTSDPATGNTGVVPPLPPSVTGAIGVTPTTAATGDVGVNQTPAIGGTPDPNAPVAGAPTTTNVGTGTVLTPGTPVQTPPPTPA
jgi:uncharacterized coiled-coil protein SlyX